MKRILFSGGGTGGHIFPALAIRDELLAQHPDRFLMAYAGQANSMEASIVGRVSALPFFPMRAQGMPREVVTSAWIPFLWRNLLGLTDALGHLRRWKPDLLVTTGGFVTFPMLLAARILGIPFVIHEQNAAIGVTNRLFVSGATRVFLTYADAWPLQPGKVMLTGNPVRSSFRTAMSPGSSSRFPKAPGEFWILIVGGSRGARSINQTTLDVAKHWLPAHPTVHLLHIAGDRDFPTLSSEAPSLPNYHLLAFLHDMHEAFGVADLLISRAGATILAEIAVAGKPAILVPFPHATDNHQEKNARTLEKIGAAEVVLDDALRSADLIIRIDRLRNDPTRMQVMTAAMLASRPTDVETRITHEIASVIGVIQHG